MYRKLIFILFWPFVFLLLLSSSVFYLSKKGYGVIYQYSQSVEPGWYIKYPLSKPIYKGEKIVIKLSQNWDDFIASRGWKKKHVPLIKQVYGVPGDEICIRNNLLYINNQKTAKIKNYDSKNRLVPNYWKNNQIYIKNISKFHNIRHYHHQHYQDQGRGCLILDDLNYLVLGLHSDRSFDGRYFGPIKLDQVESQVTKVVF